MSKINKQRNKAALKKQNKGTHKGEDKSVKPKCPHQQPSPNWATPKLKKRNSAAAKNAAVRKVVAQVADQE